MSCERVKEWLNIPRNRIKTITAIILIISIVIVGIVCAEKHKENKLVQDIQYVCLAYESQNYDYAIELARNLPEKYKEYYLDFIRYAKDIDEWEGTGKNLYVWLKAVFEKSETYKQLEFPEGVSKANKLWENVYDEKEQYDKSYEMQLMNAFDLYPQFYKIQENFYSNYFRLLWGNRELFAIASQNGVVAIPVSSILALDEEMSQLHDTSNDALQKIKINNAEEILLDSITEFEKSLDECYIDYQEHYALTVLYEIDGKTCIYITEENAQNNYDVQYKMITLNEISNSINLDTVTYSLMGLDEEYMVKLSEPTRIVVSSVIKIFQFSKPSIVDEDYKTMEEIVEEVSKG